jgi:hypothetical protein
LQNLKGEENNNQHSSTSFFFHLLSEVKKKTLRKQSLQQNVPVRKATHLLLKLKISLEKRTLLDSIIIYNTNRIYRLAYCPRHIAQWALEVMKKEESEQRQEVYKSYGILILILSTPILDILQFSLYTTMYPLLYDFASDVAKDEDVQSRCFSWTFFDSRRSHKSSSLFQFSFFSFFLFCANRQNYGLISIDDMDT